MNKIAWIVISLAAVGFGGAWLAASVLAAG